MSAVRCPQCKNRIVQKSAEGTRVRAEGAITFDPSGVCRAKCFFCKSEVVLPLELSKSAAEPEPSRFVVPVPRRGS